jgi:hypothetical protein
MKIEDSQDKNIVLKMNFGITWALGARKLPVIQLLKPMK